MKNNWKREKNLLYLNSKYILTVTGKHYLWIILRVRFIIPLIFLSEKPGIPKTFEVKFPLNFDKSDLVRLLKNYLLLFTVAANIRTDYCRESCSITTGRYGCKWHFSSHW